MIPAMRARVVITGPEPGRRTELAPGDLIGRMERAALSISDPRVSEAHAMVSLRAGELVLLSLRRLFAVEGKPSSDVVLEPGLRIELASEVELQIEAVLFPEEIMGLEADGMPLVPVPGIASIEVSPKPRITPKYRGEAAAHIWATGERWWFRRGVEDERVIAVGDSFEIEGTTFRTVGIPLAQAMRAATLAQGGALAPLRIVDLYDTVHIYRKGRPPLSISGLGAQMISELAQVQKPVSWESVARSLWPDERDRKVLRGRWDVALGRLRHRLREGGIRADLLRSDGLGNFELLLHEGDELEDQT